MYFNLRSATDFNQVTSSLQKLLLPLVGQESGKEWKMILTCRVKHLLIPLQRKNPEYYKQGDTGGRGPWKEK